MSNNFYIITGGPGTGKTKLIEELKKREFFCVDEVARKLIQEEKASDGDALPWKNIDRYIEIMIMRCFETYEDAVKMGSKTILFDRGILDYVSYSYRIKKPISDEVKRAALLLTYNKKVFMAPIWEEIYCTDKERKQTFAEAQEVNDTLFKTYSDHGYQIIELPKTSIEARADFVIGHLN